MASWLLWLLGCTKSQGQENQRSEKKMEMREETLPEFAASGWLRDGLEKGDMWFCLCPKVVMLKLGGNRDRGRSECLSCHTRVLN